MSRPFLLVGEAPNAATELKPWQWLRPDHSGIRHSANRLLEFSGMRHAEFLETFDRTNVLEFWPGKTRRARAGDRWVADVARRRVEQRAHEWQGRALILLGRRVAGAFRLPATLPWFEAVRLVTGPGDLGGTTAVVVPHTSGANRWFNDVKNIETFRAFFQGLPR